MENMTTEENKAEEAAKNDATVESNGDSNDKSTGAESVEAAAEENTETDNVEELASNEEAKDEFKEKYYYLAAEMQNMQRRFDKEKENLLKYGSEKIMNDLVGIIDNFERTLGFINKEEDEKIKNIAEGIEMINKLFMETLGKHGLKKIDALGKEFDPNFHEALAQQPAEGKPDMEVIQVYENGYTLNERVIRAAKVVVVKN